MTIEQFGKALVASGLMTADDVKAFWTAIPIDARPKSGEGFGKLLAEKGLLTPFQAAEILAGRGARLMMGDYTIVSQIGAGGMGQVYKAQHRRMKRTVALKVMSNAAMQDEAAVKRFQREVHAAARLEHPNIVTAYDSGESGSVKYLVMQFVDGGDLSELVKKGGRLPIEQAVAYVIQAAKGLAFAHGEGVIHRDIKPANLLLDKKGVVKILDMGLARFEDGGDGLTATEQVMGTVDYMSPEQAANTKGCDGRADIYSLGCTLWYLLTARKLYEGDTLIARLMLHRDGPLPSLVKERDDAPWPLEQALHKMIAKRAADRYQTMDEVVAALAPFGGDVASRGSIGGTSSGGGPSADLASFMQAMGTGATKPSGSATQIKPATSTALDATAQFTAPEVGTDPKSQVLPKASAAAKPQAATKPGTKSKQSDGNKTKLIAAGALGGILILAGIVVKIRDKDGNVIAEVNAPTGTSVEVGMTPKPAATNVSPPTPNAPATTLPAEALTFGGHRYLLVDNFCTWSQAKAKAEALGGHLATVNSREERDWILTNVFRNRPRADESDRVRQVRLGGSIAGPGGRWTWVTGEPFDESLWLGPMPTVVEKCGLCWTADSTWNNSPTDSPNARSFYFLVEWDTPGGAGPKSIAGPPAADQALQFDGKTAHVTTPLFHNATTPLTIEVTLRPGPVRGAIISNSEGSGLGLDIVNGAPNLLAFRRSSGTESYARATAPEALDMSRPHRLAAVYDGTKIRLFVDGKLAATSDLAGEYLPSDLPFVIGASPEVQGIDYQFTGTLDEVRFSKSARYTADYNPVDRLPSDPNTLAMYHFDEGSGDLLKDSSGHSRHGKVVDAKWVKVDRSSGVGATSTSAKSDIGRSLDLLPLVDLGHDILEGEWAKDGAGFVTKELKTNSRLRLPVELGEAYSLRAAFSSDSGNVSFVLPFESKGLEVALLTKRVVLCLKQPNDPTNPTANLPVAVNDAERHEALIEVTRPSATEVKIALSIDGSSALQWLGTRNQFQAVEGRRGLAPTLSVHSFLVGRSPMRLLEAQLTTTQGATKPIRRGASSTANASAASAK